MIALLLCVIAVIVPPTLQAPVQLVNLPDDAVGPKNCKHVCSGVQKWDVPFGDGDYWIDSGTFPGKVWRGVDISACKFVSPPLITMTTSRASGGGGSGICPSLTVYIVDSTYVVVYSVNDATSSDMKKIHCNINWTASGFNCN
jgi:hypothetical protein